MWCRHPATLTARDVAGQSSVKGNALRRFEGVERAAAVLVAEEPEVGAGDTLAVAQHDVPGDRLEGGAEVLARLDQDVPLAARIDPAVSEEIGRASCRERG